MVFRIYDFVPIFKKINIFVLKMQNLHERNHRFYHSNHLGKGRRGMGEEDVKALAVSVMFLFLLQISKRTELKLMWKNVNI